MARTADRPRCIAFALAQGGSSIVRRASLVAPLILIAAGVFFLARNLYPELPLFDYLARYWPYLLIAWGALRLMEILYWRNTSQPLPRQGISGGEWLLI